MLAVPGFLLPAKEEAKMRKHFAFAVFVCGIGLLLIGAAQSSSTVNTLDPRLEAQPGQSSDSSGSREFRVHWGTFYVSPGLLRFNESNGHGGIDEQHSWSVPCDQMVRWQSKSSKEIDVYATRGNEVVYMKPRIYTETKEEKMAIGEAITEACGRKEGQLK